MDSYNSITPEQQEQLWARLLRGSRRPENKEISCTVNMTQVTADLVVGELPVLPACLNPLGNVHGGCLATLADTVAGTAAAASGDAFVTLSCNMNYLRPASGKVIRCEARPQKRGKTVTVIDVALLNEKDELVTSGVFTFFRIGPLALLGKD